MKKRTWAIVATVFSALYLINPTGGFVEFLPDNLPLVGNLDEATITALLIWAISVIRGKEINFKSGDPVDNAKPAQKPDED